jgi:hypothetical protein
VGSSSTAVLVVGMSGVGAAGVVALLMSRRAAAPAVRSSARSQPT